MNVPIPNQEDSLPLNLRISQVVLRNRPIPKSQNTSRCIIRQKIFGKDGLASVSANRVENNSDLYVIICRTKLNTVPICKDSFIFL